MTKKATAPKPPKTPAPGEKSADLKPGMRERINFERVVDEAPKPDVDGQDGEEFDCPHCEDEGCPLCEITSAPITADPPPEPTPLQRLLQSLQGKTDASIYVIRKSDPVMLRGKFRESCDIEETKGQLPYEDSFTDEEAVAIAVQSVFGGGVYKLQVRQGGTILKTWTQTIADPRDRGPVVAEVIPPAPHANGKAEEVDPLDAITKQAEKINKLKSALIGPELARMLEAHKELPPAPPPVNSDPSLSAFLTLTEKNPTLAEKFINRFLPEEDKKSWWADVIANPQESMQVVGFALQMVGQMFGRVPQPNGNGQPQQPPDPLMEMLEPMRPLIEALCVELANNSDTDAAVALVRYHVQQNPALEMYLPAIVERSSVEVITVLAKFTNQPILLKLKWGAEWVENLQDALKPEGEGEGDTGEGEGEGDG